MSTDGPIDTRTRRLFLCDRVAAHEAAVGGVRPNPLDSFFMIQHYRQNGVREKRSRVGREWGADDSGVISRHMTAPAMSSQDTHLPGRLQDRSLRGCAARNSPVRDPRTEAEREQRQWRGL